METLWRYHDHLGLAQAVELGRARALAGDWTSGSLASRVRAFRGWLLDRSMCMGNLWGEVTANPNGLEVYIYPGMRRPSVPIERADAAITLYRTPFILGRYAAREAGEIVTEHRATEGDVGLPWPLIAAAAIVSVGQAVAIGYCAHQAALVVDRHLARREQLRTLVQRDQTVLELVRRHQAREDTAKKPLPLDAATKQALESLARQQEAIASRPESPLESGLPALPTLAAGTGGFTLGAVAAGAFAIWLVMTATKI